jgi:hypothetical protein
MDLTVDRVTNSVSLTCSGSLAIPNHSGEQLGARLSGLVVTWSKDSEPTVQVNGWTILPTRAGVKDVYKQPLSIPKAVPLSSLVELNPGLLELLKDLIPDLPQN